MKLMLLLVCVGYKPLIISTIVDSRKKLTDIIGYKPLIISTIVDVVAVLQRLLRAISH